MMPDARADTSRWTKTRNARARNDDSKTSNVMALGWRKIVLEVSATVLYLSANVSGSVFQSPSTCTKAYVSMSR